MKKLMLLALAAVSAMLVVPVGASAETAHLSETPGEFKVHGGASTLSRADGVKTTGTTVTGSGSFENTTTGTLNLHFHGVRDSLNRQCSSSGHTLASETVTANGLKFHLIMVNTNKPGILITPPAGQHFATFTCGTLFSTTVTVTGNGIIGTITAPECGKPSKIATVSFKSVSNGNQEDMTWTGTKYDLDSTLNGGSLSTSAMDATATITFESEPTLQCTP